MMLISSHDAEQSIIILAVYLQYDRDMLMTLLYVLSWICL